MHVHGQFVVFYRVRCVLVVSFCRILSSKVWPLWGWQTAQKCPWACRGQKCFVCDKSYIANDQKNGLTFSGFENIQQQGHCSTFLGKNGGKTLNIYIRCVSSKAIVQLSSVKMEAKR